MDKNQIKWDAIGAKKRRIRKTIAGDAVRPRLSVYRSEAHIYGQIIDDTSGQTLAAASDLEPELRGTITGSKSERAKRVGQELATRAQARGIQVVVFDRGGFLYHGRVKSLAEGAREGGLQF